MKRKELLLYPYVAVLKHFLHDALHVFYYMVSFCLTFQFPEFVLLSCHHLVVASTHPFQQGLFAGFGRIPPGLDDELVRHGIHFGPFVLDKGASSFSNFNSFSAKSPGLINVPDSTV